VLLIVVRVQAGDEAPGHLVLVEDEPPAIRNWHVIAMPIAREVVETAEAEVMLMRRIVKELGWEKCGVQIDPSAREIRSSLWSDDVNGAP
jgi:hypothetical protein